MKILCIVCEASEAMVWCCGDEAPLCNDCDKEVHSSNKLASRHRRVSLMQTTGLMPKCDICQEAAGYFFCREDRALLCSRCDLAVHSVNIHVSAHQRFLFAGVKVDPEQLNHVSVAFSSVEKFAEKQTCKTVHKASPSEHVNVQPVRELETNGLASAERCLCEGIQERQLNDIFENTDFGQSNLVKKPRDNQAPIFSIDDIDIDPDENLVPAWRVDANLYADDNIIQDWIAADLIHPRGNQNLGQNDNSCRTKLGDTDSSSAMDPTLDDDAESLIKDSTDDFLLDTAENLSQAWAVPELTSSDSEFNWANADEHQMDSATVYVPEVTSSLVEYNHPFQENGYSLKRKRIL